MLACQHNARFPVSIQHKTTESHWRLKNPILMAVFWLWTPFKFSSKTHSSLNSIQVGFMCTAAATATFKFSVFSKAKPVTHQFFPYTVPSVAC